MYKYSKHREYQRQYMRKLHDLAIEKLGGKCVSCGISDKRVLQINHKNHGGSKEYEELGPRKVYSQIIRGLRTDCEVRCANCNVLYEYESGTRKIYI